MVSFWGRWGEKGLGGEGGGGQTLGHPQISPHHQHKLALLAPIILHARPRGGRSSSSSSGGSGSTGSGRPKTLPAVGLGAVGPVGRVVEQRLLLVDVGLLALDRVVVGGGALGGQVGRREQPAADRPDA